VFSKDIGKIRELIRSGALMRVIQDSVGELEW
jgi:hypothetical protein